MPGIARAVADWWDGIELWITQLAFPVQVLLAIVVVLPLCAMVAVLLDRVSEWLVAAVRHGRDDAVDP